MTAHINIKKIKIKKPLTWEKKIKNKKTLGTVATMPIEKTKRAL